MVPDRYTYLTFGKRHPFRLSCCSMPRDWLPSAFTSQRAFTTKFYAMPFAYFPPSREKGYFFVAYKDYLAVDTSAIIPTYNTNHESSVNALEHAVKKALDTKGSTNDANKAYLEFIKANFLIPIEKNTVEGEPIVLFLEDGDQHFLPVFTDVAHVDAWALDIGDKIQLLTLSGIDLLKGIGEQVTVCLNLGSAAYKEFNPAELARMRSMVLKLFSSEKDAI